MARNGIDWKTSKSMDPLERRAAVYMIAEMDGREIDWETGDIIKKA